MGYSLPSKRAIQCTGISMILSHILLAIAWSLQAIDFDSYDVNNEDDILKLHSILSSPEHRIEIEIAVTLTWISFPMILMAVYGISRTLYAMSEGTFGEAFIYLFEKAYLMWITVVMIIIPAVALSSVSYDWTFNESHVDNTVPIGYYIQFYITMYYLELIDCVSIADATLLISIYVGKRILILEASKENKKLQKVLEISEPQICKKLSCGSIRFTSCSAVIIVCVLFIIYCIVLFEFAESGFFSPTSHAKVLVIVVFIFKMLIGLRFIAIGCTKQYDQLNDLNKPLNSNILYDQIQTQNYKMETIDVDSDKKNDM